MPYHVLNLNEVAEHLHLSPAEVERLVRNQDIPFEKRGKRLVFRKTDVEAWASRRILGLKGRRLADYDEKSSQDTEGHLTNGTLMPELVKPEFIVPALPAKTKASVLREMAALAAATGRVPNERGLLESLQARETLCSTGLPGGLALLHPRLPDSCLVESPFIVLGRTVQEIPFGAPDGGSTDLFFLLGCPDDRLHLHTLARLCLMAQTTNLLTDLRQCVDAQAMCRAILLAEETALTTRAKCR